MAKKKFAPNGDVVDQIFNLSGNRPPKQGAAVVKPVKEVNAVNVAKEVNVVPRKSKHYDTRGKRGERLVIHLDGALKKDIADLSRAAGSTSINDFVVTVLLGYIDQDESQSMLARYRDILKGSGT